MKRDDFAAMLNDLEAVKKFLVEKNNDEELNVRLLTVVAADMSAVIAFNWAARDWSFPNFPGRVQGQDVRALVLLSPPLNFHGLPTSGAFQHPVVRGSLSTMIVVGKDDGKAYREAKSLEKQLMKWHVRIPDSASAAEKKEKKDLFFVSPATQFQGIKLLTGGLNVDAMIAQFVKLRISDRLEKDPALAWVEHAP